ncbi:helix-turn-helix domain-containing protein [Streptomyces syringium]|uniref:helix-turn-helix domain-containing protein n=1 Tax=Streptomyces syringium TaxID=76729 RepID=UPI00345701C8
MHLRDPQRFDELLRLNGLSQRKLAAQVHVSQAFISLVVSGQRGCSPVTAWRIASALGVYAGELFVRDRGAAAPTEAQKPAPAHGAPQPPSHRSGVRPDCAPTGARLADSPACSLTRRSKSCPSLPSRHHRVWTPA